MEIRSRLEGLKSIFGAGQTAATTPQVRPRSQTGAASPGSDRATVSAAASEVFETADASDVRMDKVASIRSQLAAGTYNIPASAVASKLVESMLGGGRKKVTDSAMGSPVSRLTLATSANNGTLNSGDLKSVSNQTAGIRDEVQSLANSSYQGQYIFAGGQTSSAPFTTSNAATPAATSYNGDTDVNSLQTPNGETIHLNVPGSQIFTAGGVNDVFAALNNLIADYSNGTGVGASVTDTESLNWALNYV